MNELNKKIASLRESLLNGNNELLVWADEDPELFRYSIEIFAKALHSLDTLKKLADQKLSFDMEIEAGNVSITDIESIAKLAEEFDASGDEFLQKQAAVIDQLIINFSQRSLKAEAETAEEKELAKIRAEYRAKSREGAYNKVREEHEKDIKSADAVKAIKKQIKEYRPLESSLSTRYCPDHPGSQVRRVGDNAYQCALDKKIYNWQEGFETEKGNKVPGGDVGYQTKALSDQVSEHMSFSTRESRLNENQ